MRQLQPNFPDFRSDNFSKQQWRGEGLVGSGSNIIVDGDTTRNIIDRIDKKNGSAIQQFQKNKFRVNERRRWKVKQNTISNTVAC